MRTRTRFAALSLVAAWLAAAHPAEGASPWSEHEVVAARLVAAPLGPATPDAAAQGAGGQRGGAAARELRLGLHLRLAPGWHVYWRHPGDAGLPPEVVLSADTPLGSPRLLFPAPERYELRGGLVANGYDGAVVYPLRVELPAGAAPPARLTASVDYLACEDECIPFHDDLAIDVGTTTREEATLLEQWEARVPLPVAARPGLVASAAWRGSATGGELVIGLAGASARDVFVAPVEGVVVGNPRREEGAPGSGAPTRVVVPLEPQTAGAMPENLRVAWVATGIAGAGAGEAVEGTLEVATAGPTPPSDASGAATADPAGEEERGAAGGDSTGPLERVARGAALALTPGALAALLLAASAAGAGAGRRLLAPAAAGLALAALLAGLELTGRSAGISLPLAEPRALAALALPQLALTLALWWSGSVGLGRRAPAWGWALAAALLTLPFAPALWGASPGLSAAALVPLAAGFAASWLVALGVAAAARARAPGEGASRRAAPWLAPALGFLPAASLAWICYRLAPALPSARLAALQVAWLAAGLAAWLARGARPTARAVWWAAALASAAASLWLAR